MPRKATTNIVSEESVSTSAVGVDSSNGNSKANESRISSQEPLTDITEIEVVSLIPSVSYKDSKNGEYYAWDNVGDIEILTFETLKNMWRNYKSYFRNLWLKPMDNRVIEKFGLSKIYDTYEYLMDSSSYTKENIENICSQISKMDNSLKTTVIYKIKEMVANDKIESISVIKTLENKFKVELI